MGSSVTDCVEVPFAVPDLASTVLRPGEPGGPEVKLCTGQERPVDLTGRERRGLGRCYLQTGLRPV